MTRPLRILHVTRGDDGQTAAQWLLPLMRQLDPNLCRVDLVQLGEPECPAHKELRSFGCRVWVSSSPAPALSLLRVLRANGPYDAMHSHLQAAGAGVFGLAAAAGIGVRIVHSHHDTLRADRYCGLGRTFRNRASRYGLRRLATHGLASSQRAADSLFGSHWRTDARWQVHVPALDFDFGSDAPARGALRQQLGIPADALVLGHAGPFFASLDRPFLLDLAAHLLTRDARWHFIFAGGDSLTADTTAQAERLGILSRCRFVPADARLPQLLRGVLDVFALPGASPDLNPSLIAAQAAGLPCFTTTTIPDEAVLLPALMHRLPVAEGPSAWACRITNALRSSAFRQRVPSTAEAAAAALAASDFAAPRSARWLLDFYCSAINGHSAAESLDTEPHLATSGQQP